MIWVTFGLHLRHPIDISYFISEGEKFPPDEYFYSLCSEYM